ncbi:MAG: MBL fold metallo-hydrolase [archaeon GB-1867-005]|nr:MBL fold metallo-hydrolase [Candidatus Culexmicrobium cathedralense]
MRRPWSLFWFRGILLILEDFSFSLDPMSRSAEGDFILISHAHGDHIAGFRSRKPKIASYLTIRLYEAQSGRKLANVFPAFLDSQRFSIGNLDVEVYDSGHILGSSQFLFKHRSSTMVYTGDLNLEETLITKPAKPLECEELIIDATYGHPKMAFPDRHEVYMEIADFVESSLKSGLAPAFLAYPIGKAQELIALMNSWLDVEVLVDDQIERVNRVYREFGFNFNCIGMSSGEGLEALKSHALPAVVSSKATLRIAEKYDMLKAISTGWALLYPFKNFDATFPLSSHADFPQLVSYIEESKPSAVYAVGYFAKPFADWVRKKLGVEAKFLGD